VDIKELGDERLGRVQSLVRAFGVLDALCGSDGITLSDVARAVALPRSTTHRLLTTMEGLGYVRFDRSCSHWLIGMQAFKVGAAFVQTKDLGQLGQDIMRSLMVEVRHSVNISVRDKNAMCYLSQVKANVEKRVGPRPGACLPLYSTAAGKALMAGWTERELDRFLLQNRLYTRTQHTIADPDSLRRELRLVNERGYAIDDEEHELGLRCVAAMIVDKAGGPRGAISVSDTAIALKPDRLIELGPILALSARKLSSQIAHQLP
jgi:IclR family acetate operon transcriptional repressor